MQLDQSKKELVRFLVTGLLAVGCDFSTYFLLIESLPTDLAKAISFISGSVLGFFMNKLWTFESNVPTHTAFVQFSILYSITFLANVAVNHLALLAFNDMSVIAFLLATATSTILNFIGMKFWVFKPNADEQA